MPYFTVETSPAEPRPNEPILVVVRFWADAEHTQTGGSEDWSRAFAAAVKQLDDLLVVRRAGSPDIPVHLTQVQADRFEGRITLPAGDWTLVAFPDRSDFPLGAVTAGYPDTIGLTVREPGPASSVIMFGVILLVGVVFLGRLRLRSWTSRGPKPSISGPAYSPASSATRSRE